VEFGQHGNACYVYSAKEFQELRDRNEAYVRSYGEVGATRCVTMWKDASLLYQRSSRATTSGTLSLGLRMMHRGEWQYDFEYTISKLTGERLDTK